jgi:hypothetical protein
MKRRKQLRNKVIPSEQKGTSLAFWVVAFLDLLGYRTVLKQFDVVPLPSNPDAQRALEKAFARSVHLRTRLLGGIGEFMTSADSVTPPDLAKLPKGVRKLADSWRQINLVGSPGPDHIVLACSLAREKDHFPMRGVYTLVTAAASATLLQLSIGSDDPEGSLPLRGGMDIAPGGVYGTDHVLYSPAVARAYDLESMQSVVPRTIAGERFRAFLLSTATEPPEDLDGQYSQALARRLSRMFFEDRDGWTTLDFLGDAFREQTDQDLGKTLAGKAWRFVRDTERALRSGRDKRLLAKYAWLVDYMIPRLLNWGVQP